MRLQEENQHMTNSKQVAISGKSLVEQTKASIRQIHCQDVILAADVAVIYGETTKRINRRTESRQFFQTALDDLEQLTTSNYSDF